jgi:hypothetical protein
MKIATKKATVIENEDAQKGALMVSSDWNKEEKKAMTNFIDAVKNRNIALQKDLEKKHFNS